MGTCYRNIPTSKHLESVCYSPGCVGWTPNRRVGSFFLNELCHQKRNAAKPTWNGNSPPPNAPTPYTFAGTPPTMSPLSMLLSADPRLLGLPPAAQSTPPPPTDCASVQRLDRHHAGARLRFCDGRRDPLPLRDPLPHHFPARLTFVPLFVAVCDLRSKVCPNPHPEQKPLSPLAPPTQ